MDIEIDPQAETVIFRSEGKAEHHYRRGDIIGESYQLLDLIGQGGMGVVYRVKHLILGKQYALKLLAPNQINSQSWRRFELEGRSLAKLNHANIVAIHNMGIDKGCPYFVMDLLEGMSLGERIKSSGPLSEQENLDIYLQVCAGLSCAHKNGIIHRDIKPGNIMLVPAANGMLVKIVDFGMARLQTTSGSASQALTASGEIFGSPYYMSPEQTLGEEMDARSDIYSLGCSLFETLTGRVPFTGTTAIQTLMMHQEDQPPVPSSLMPSNTGTSGKISQAIDSVVARCLKKEAKQRYQSADQLALDLQRIIDGKPIGKAIGDLGSRRPTGLSPNLNVDEDEDGAAGEDQREGNTKQQAASGFFGQLWQRKSPLAITAIASLAVIAGAALAIVLVSDRSEPSEQVAKKNKNIEPLSLNDDRIFEVENSVQKAKQTGNSSTSGNQAKPTGSNFILDSITEIKVLNDAPRISAGIQNINGKKMRCFNFPNEIRIGRIHSTGTKSQPAQGKVMLPADQNVILHLDARLDNCPTIVDKIAPEDIYSLRLDGFNAVGSITKRLGNWTKLHSLTIDGGSISDSDLEYFDEFKALKDLWIKRLTFDWKEFVHLKVLLQLDCLEIENCKQLDEILQHAPTMPKLETLHIEGRGPNWLTGKSIAALRKHPKLRKIYLKTQLAAEKFESLDISKTIVQEVHRKPQAIPIYDWRNDFAKLTQVKRIVFDKPSWSQEQVAEFLLTVPAARVNKWATER